MRTALLAMGFRPFFLQPVREIARLAHERGDLEPDARRIAAIDER
jgi:hypothetical protein